MRVESTALVPSIDTTVYIVLDEFEKIGRSYRETDETRSDLDAVVADMLSGQFNRPLRVVAFNTAEGWSRDCSEDVAWRVAMEATRRSDRLPDRVREFVEYHIGLQEALWVESGL
jgi:hypothetical protein